jgi:hypothetical protein
MEFKKINLIEMEKEVFNIKNKAMTPGAWLYWFWLFFFNNPKNPEKPRQLMILWSSKNEKEIECNNLKLKLNPPLDKKNLRGVVAAWYFDGEKMHHNFLLEPCDINVSDKMIYSDCIPTSFSINKNKNIIKIGNEIEFIAEAENKHVYSRPIYKMKNYIANKNYSILELKHLKLRGKIKNEPIHGSAYFQRVFYNIPYPSWYWGIFHFENGNILTYLNPYLFGKSLKKSISFFDGSRLHDFNDINVKLSKENMPVFIVSGENEQEKINFSVKSYAQTSWNFRKKLFSIIPNKLIYNQYPSVISELKLINKKTGEKITLDDLGKSVGNAEHGIGFLF